MVPNLTILWEAFHDRFIPWSKELILRSGEDFAGRPVSVLLLSTVTKVSVTVTVSTVTNLSYSASYSPGKISSCLYPSISRVITIIDCIQNYVFDQLLQVT